MDPAETWGHTTAPEPRPFRPDGYLVFVAPSRDATTGAPAWPLATAAAAFGSPSAVDRGVAGLRAGLVIGSDAGLLASRLARVQAGTVLASGGHGWSVWVRPLYPDELGT